MLISSAAILLLTFVQEFETNDTLATANTIACYAGEAAVVECETFGALTDSDPDWFKFYGYAGETVDIVIGDPTIEVTVYDESETVLSGPSDEITALAINADALVYIKITGTQAANYTLNISITDCPVVQETEPNDAKETATDVVLESDATIDGLAYVEIDGSNNPDNKSTSACNAENTGCNESDDWFRIIGAQGDRLSVSLFPQRGDYRGQVALYDASGDVLYSDTYDGPGYVSRLSNIELTTTGYYFVHVNGSWSSARGAYRLQLTTAPASWRSTTTEATTPP